MPDITIIATGDGSHTLHNASLNETYHSIHGAVQESNHVFIKQGIEYWLQQNAGKAPRILEIGFGTGLNALLTQIFSKRNGLSVYYESWEKSPLESEIVERLNYGELLSEKEMFKAIHGAAWSVDVPLAPKFVIRKHPGDVVIDSFTSSFFDVIFFDAFAPAKQPEMWSVDVLKKVTLLLAPGGVWVTYSAKGQLKRDLAALGLAVETLEGPPGKKEMTRARRLNT